MTKARARKQAFLVNVAVLVLAGLCAGQPAVSLSRESGPPTVKLLVSGRDFNAGHIVDIYFDQIYRTQCVTDGKGNFSNIPIRVPRKARPGAHPVTAVEQPSRKSAKQQFLVRVNWRQLGFSPNGSRLNPYENVLDPDTVGTLGLKWSFAASQPVSSPAVVNGVVYVGSSDGNVYALDTRTGSLLWSYLANAYVSTPAVVDGVVYFGTGDWNVYAVDARTGSPLWKYRTGGQIASSPTVASGVVYVGSGDNNLYALNASTGALLWSHGVSAPYSPPAVADGVVYVGSDNGNLYALNAGTGVDLWSYPAGVYALASVAHGVVYVGGGYTSQAYALKASSGALLWSFTTGGYVFSTPTLTHGLVYVASDNMYALDARTGAKVWAYPTGSSPSSPAVANGVVYVGSSVDDNVYALNPATGAKLWSYSTGSYVDSSPAVANGVVYVGAGNNVYAFGLPGAEQVKHQDTSKRRVRPSRKLANLSR
jgi:outer membrane protein assembly factor BamB